MITWLVTAEQAEAFLKGSQPVLIYKHSYRCNLCEGAIAVVEAFALERPELRVGMIDVVEHRVASDAIANVGQVIHQSPQVILFEKGKATWETSHRDITIDTLKENIK